MFMANSILLLVYRNLVAAIDRIFLVWQIAFPVVYIFVAVCLVLLQ
jgi:ABC-2 type transport system permease protein